jgi:hypothetical protein
MLLVVLVLTKGTTVKVVARSKIIDSSEIIVELNKTLLPLRGKSKRKIVIEL